MCIVPGLTIFFIFLPVFLLVFKCSQNYSVKTLCKEKVSATKKSWGPWYNIVVRCLRKEICCGCGNSLKTVNLGESAGDGKKGETLGEEGDGKGDTIAEEKEGFPEQVMWSPSTKKVQTLEMGTMAGKRTPPSTPVQLMKKYRYEEVPAVALSPKKFGKKKLSGVAAAAGTGGEKMVDDDDNLMWGTCSKKKTTIIL